jgi:hypothetical protein
MSRQGVGISLLPYLTVVSYWPGVVAHRQPESSGTKAPFVTEDADFPMNFLVAVLLAAVAPLGIAIWSIKRHKDPHLELDTDAPLQELITSLSGGVWCAVGSSNFDDRSFETNDEITGGFHDEALARRLEQIFEADLRHCVELTAAAWRARGLWHRVKDNAFYLFNEVL